MTSAVLDAINRQICSEFSASFSYLSMAAWCEKENFTGAAQWLRVQSQEEHGHAMKLFDFVLARDAKVELKPLSEPGQTFSSLADVFEKALAQEQDVSRQIDALYETAFKEKAFAAVAELQWFLTEQVEEEQSAREILAKLRALAAAEPAERASRLASLDQFRGYTVVGMLLVNYLGFECVPRILTHTHDYNSYADTIMPHFLFAVGFALRLAHGRRVEALGAHAATVRILERVLWLLLIGAVYYNLETESWARLAKGDVLHWLGLTFQTLVHIAVTTLWILPVVRARPALLLAFAAAFLVKMPLFPVHGWMPDGYRAMPLPVLAVCAAIAGAIPALRASSIDPVRALRVDN